MLAIANALLKLDGTEWYGGKIDYMDDRRDIPPLIHSLPHLLLIVKCALQFFRQLLPRWWCREIRPGAFALMRHIVYLFVVSRHGEKFYALPHAIAQDYLKKGKNNCESKVLGVE
jgi:hypothetical protein